MGTRKLTAEDLDRIAAVAKGWGKIVVRRAFGDQGPGLEVDLAQMEQIAQAAARGLTAGTLEEATAQQAQLLGDHQPCPGCGRPCPAPPRTAPSTSPVAPSSTVNRCATARPAVGIFVPQRLLLKLDTHGYSPALLHKILGTAGQVKSYELASRVVQLVGDIRISGRHINRLTEEIGTELQERRDRETEDYVHHRRQPPQRPAPRVAAIALDGGRIQTRATGQGPGVHGQGWKED